MRNLLVPLVAMLLTGCLGPIHRGRARDAAARELNCQTVSVANQPGGSDLVERTKILTAHGLGDNILGLQCASFIPGCQVISCSRDDVFRPLDYLFSARFQLRQSDLKDKWGHENYILSNQQELNELQKDGPVYFVIPDLLFRGPLAFDYRKYNLSPPAIRSRRLLMADWKPQKIVYVGLCTSTDGYLYHDIPGLLKNLGAALPDYIIYFPNLKQWAGRYLSYGDLSNLGGNVHIHENPDFCESLDFLKRSAYGIFTDNGPSHVAYQLGMPRLLLDPRVGAANIAWRARWRETDEESIQITIDPKAITEIVKTNLETPETLLIRRTEVWVNRFPNWPRELIFKY